jgi:hypothetical protein
MFLEAQAQNVIALLFNKSLKRGFDSDVKSV